MQGIGSFFLQPVGRLSQSISAHALGSPLPHGGLLCLARGNGTGQHFYGTVWCCVP